MILFFDRNIGRRIPQALRDLNVPCQIEDHYAHFAHDTPDDEWLPLVGAWGWTVVAQDHKFHLLENEAEALRQHQVGCFYLWGAEAPRWETMRVFAKAYDKIILEAGRAPRPFAFFVQRHGGLTEIPFL